MRHKLHLAAVVAMPLMTASSVAFAQASGGGAGSGGAQGGASSSVGSGPPAAAPTNPGSAGISSAPGGQSGSTTGIGIGGRSTTTNPTLYQPGAPNTSPGTSETGLSSNGMPDEDAVPPGSSGRIGR
ncbi:hypothetical protein [Bradyrhizobium cenepequi]